MTVHAELGLSRFVKYLVTRRTLGLDVRVSRDHLPRHNQRLDLLRRRIGIVKNSKCHRQSDYYVFVPVHATRLSG